LIAAAFGISQLVGSSGNSQADNSRGISQQDEPVDYEQAYAHVFDQYRELISWDADSRTAFFGTEEGHGYDPGLWGYDSSVTPDIRYNLLDMDGDDKPELILGADLFQGETQLMDIWALDADNSPVFAYRNARISALYGFELIVSNDKYYAFSRGGDGGAGFISFTTLHSDAVVQTDIPAFSMWEAYQNGSICSENLFSYEPVWGDNGPVAQTYEHNETPCSKQEYLDALGEYGSAIEVNDQDGYVNVTATNPIELHWKTLDEAPSIADTVPPDSPESAAADSSAGMEIYAELPDSFIFASGAGAWMTGVTIHPDGSFEGTYHDSDMGDTGPGYPNGSRAECQFNGQFSAPTRINDYEYSMRIVNLEYDPVGVETIVDGVRIISVTPYGFDNADEFRLYLPGRATADLPEEFINWVEMPNVWSSLPVELPFYGLYNIGGQEGFFS
jgi:hypothetical protein